MREVLGLHGLLQIDAVLGDRLVARLARLHAMLVALGDRGLHGLHGIAVAFGHLLHRGVECGHVGALGGLPRRVAPGADVGAYHAREEKRGGESERVLDRTT